MTVQLALARYVFLALLLPAFVVTSLEKGETQRHGQWRQLWYSDFEEFQRLTEPSFDNNTISNITVQLGGTAFLHCRVRNLGERTISWVRRRDWHILTSGMFTYTNDERFQVLHGEGSDDWTLQIKYVQKRDNGTYECQETTFLSLSASGKITKLPQINWVNPVRTSQDVPGRQASRGSHPPVGTFAPLLGVGRLEANLPALSSEDVYLIFLHHNKVEHPRGFLEPPAVHILSYLADHHPLSESPRMPKEPMGRSGQFMSVSTGNGIMSHFVNLHIVVPEAFILGSGEHHVDTGSSISLVCMIEKSPVPPQYVFWFHNDRMINYDTARGGITVETNPGPKTQSHLTIRDAVDTDSGNYTCSASNTEPASIFVFVSEGDKMAAIQRRKTSNGTVVLDVVLWFIILPILSMIIR